MHKIDFGRQWKITNQVKAALNRISKFVIRQCKCSTQNFEWQIVSLNWFKSSRFCSYHNWQWWLPHILYTITSDEFRWEVMHIFSCPKNSQLKCMNSVCTIKRDWNVYCVWFLYYIPFALFLFDIYTRVNGRFATRLHAVDSQFNLIANCWCYSMQTILFCGRIANCARVTTTVCDAQNINYSVIFRQHKMHCHVSGIKCNLQLGYYSRRYWNSE